MRAVSRPCLVVSAFLLFASLAVAQELTEAQVVLQFMEQNPEVRALRHRVDEQRQQNRERTLVANPTFTYTQENAAGARDDFLLFRQPLPVTGRRSLFDTANREATASTEAEIEYEIHRLRTGVRSTFAALLRAQRREQALADALRVTEETVRVLAAREREGEGSRFDRLRGETELEELRATLAEETIARVRAQSNLAGLLGVAGTASTLVAAAGPEEDPGLPPVDQAVERALAFRADLRAGSSRLASVNAEQEAGRRLRFPEPSLTGGMKRTRVRGVSDLGYTFAVEMTLPLSNHGQAESDRAVATSNRLRADQDVLRLRIEREVRMAHRIATLTRQQARAYIEGAGVSGAELAGIARLAYEEGEQGILELIDAHRVALATRLRGIDLRTNVWQARIELSHAVGSEVFE